MHIFYTPDINTIQELPEEESSHAIRVLRLTEGDEILLVDGIGNFYKAVITRAHHKRCSVEILDKYSEPDRHYKVCIAVAPTKNIDRIEWFTEKSAEIGIDSLTLLKCRYSERKDVKKERISKILVSAMKQSQKASLTELESLVDFKSFVARPFDGQKFIAHCYKGAERQLLKDVYVTGSNALVLIGPEGDFSEEEVQQALDNGFRPVSLGTSRLRTETAALVACHTINFMNE